MPLKASLRGHGRCKSKMNLNGGITFRCLGELIERWVARVKRICRGIQNTPLLAYHRYQISILETLLCR